MKAHYDQDACLLPVCSFARRVGGQYPCRFSSHSTTERIHEDVQFCPQQSEGQKSQLRKVVHPYFATFTGKPGRTDLTVHHVDHGDHPPIQQTAYLISLRSNAPANLQCLVHQLLEGLKVYAVAYLYDIAVFSPIWEEHLNHLSQVLRWIQKSDRHERRAISRTPNGWRDSATRAEGRCHLSLADPKNEKNRLCPFWVRLDIIGNLTIVPYRAKRLIDLTKKKLLQIVHWSAVCEHSFAVLKAALASFPVLQAPDFN